MLTGAYPLLVTVGDAAYLLGTSRWTIADMCRKKELVWIPWRRSKKVKRLPLDGLIAYIRAHLVTSDERLKQLLDRRFADHLRRAARSTGPLARIPSVSSMPA